TLRHGGVGHLRGRCRDLGAERVQVANPLVIPFPEEVPDRGFGWHYIGLVAAVRDYVMRAMLRTQMLAAEIPADVHQLDRVQRAASRPGRSGGMGALAVKAILSRDQA